MLETQVNLKSTFGARKQGPIGTLSDANVHVRNNGKKKSQVLFIGAMLFSPPNVYGL